MAQAPTNPKIEELRARLKADSKSRLFYPLAEELRKVSQFAEAEQVLRTGLTHHPTYLSAWVSLGRVLRDVGKDSEASEALAKALQLDPGNVVAARLLADAYLALGQKVEAIKKYKLVYALMPSDESVEAIIERLEGELNPPPPAKAELEPQPEAPEPQAPARPEPEPLPFAEPEPLVALAPDPAPFVAEAVAPEPEPEPEPEPQPEPGPEPVPFVGEAVGIDESPFANDDVSILAAAEETFTHEQEAAVETADDEPMLVAHADSPFEEPAPDFTADAIAVEEPLGIHIDEAPLVAETPTPRTVEGEPPADVFTATVETPFDLDGQTVGAAEPAEDLTETTTMADLYARQGLTSNAREIYDRILQRHPDDAAVREKRDALEPETSPGAAGRSPRVTRLENWLAKVGRKEAGGV